MSHSTSATLFKASRLGSASDVVVAVVKMVDKFEQMGWQMPPLPSDPGSLAPCSIEVMEYDGFSPRQRIIRFYREGLSDDLFSEHWEASLALQP
jgi:hypothetical protein